MKREEWRDVVGYEGMYQVSSAGRVRGIDRTTVSKAGWSRTVAGRILKGMPNRVSGYLYVSPCVKGHNQPELIHRLVLSAFVGPCPDGMECRHINGDKTDNRIENLAWSSHVENMRDKHIHGTQASGENHYSAKLSDIGVRVVRRLLEFGSLSQREIANCFGVSQSLVSLINLNKCRVQHG